MSVQKKREREVSMMWETIAATIALIAIIAALVWLNVMLWQIEEYGIAIISNILTASFLIVFFLGTLDIAFGIDVLGWL